MIKEINIDGIKKTVGAKYSLSRLNLISGENGAGKTTIMDSISILIEGKHPRNGKQLSDIMMLCPSGHATIEGVVEKNGDEERFAREFISSKGKNSQKLYVNGRKVKPGEGKEKISSWFGAFAPRVNIGRFIDMSSQEKGKFLFSLFGQKLKGMTTEKVATEVLRSLLREEDDFKGMLRFVYKKNETDLTDEEKTELFEKVLEGMKGKEWLYGNYEKVRGIVGIADKRLDVQTYISEIVDDLRQSANDIHSMILDKKGVVRELQESADPNIDSEKEQALVDNLRESVQALAIKESDLNERKEKIESLREKILEIGQPEEMTDDHVEELKEQKSSLFIEKSSLEKKNQFLEQEIIRLKNTAEKIEKLKEKIVEGDDHAESLNQEISRNNKTILREKELLAAIKQKKTALKIKDNNDKIKKEIASAREVLNEKKAELEKTREKKAEVEESLKSITAEYNILDYRYKEIQGKITQIGESKSCPVCGNTEIDGVKKKLTAGRVSIAGKLKRRKERIAQEELSKSNIIMREQKLSKDVEALTKTIFTKDALIVDVPKYDNSVDISKETDIESSISGLEKRVADANELLASYEKSIDARETIEMLTGGGGDIPGRIEGIAREKKEVSEALLSIPNDIASIESEIAEAVKKKNAWDEYQLIKEEMKLYALDMIKDGGDTDLASIASDSWAKISEEIEGVVDKKREKEALIKEVNKKIKLVIENEGRLKTIEKMHTEIEDITAEWQYFKKATAKAEEIRVHLIEGMLGGVNKKINSIAQPILRKGKAVLTADFCGIEESGIRKDIRVLSGGEAVIFSAATLIALMQESNVPEKILMLEAGELDNDNLSLLLNVLVGVDIDNILISTFTRDIDIPEEWNVISL